MIIKDKLLRNIGILSCIISLIICIIMIATIDAKSIVYADQSMEKVSTPFYETEDNDSKDTADHISCNQIIEASFSSYYDIDWFRFLLADETQIDIKFNPNSSDYIDVYFTIYDINGNGILHKEVWGYGSSASYSVDLSAGEYYIKITTFDRAYNYSFIIELEHEHEGEIYIVNTPTCISPGRGIKECNICGYREEIYLPRTEYHRYDDGYQIQESTILEMGEILYTCTDCGHQEYAIDKSKVWILPTIIVGSICFVLAVIGLVFYLIYLFRDDDDDTFDDIMNY